jgi:hypothetical protein
MAEERAQSGLQDPMNLVSSCFQGQTAKRDWLTPRLAMKQSIPRFAFRGLTPRFCE